MYRGYCVMGKAKQTSKKPMIDLHGITVDEAIIKVDEFLHKHSSGTHQRLYIMTGKGSGKVQKAVIQYLKKAHYPWKHDEMGPGKVNKGLLVVFND